MKPSDDNQIFDRLVDNELSARERSELLGSLDERPDGWRQCALAFLEHQSWSHQMKAMVTSPTVDKVSPAKEESSKTSNRTMSVLAMAACLLVAFLVGRTMTPKAASPDGDLENQMAITEEQRPIDPRLVPAQPGANDLDVVTLLVRDDRGQPKRVRVPLVELTADNEAATSLAESLPENLRQRFKRQGKDLRVRRRYAPLYFEQNEQVVPMAVPVDDAYLVPVGGPVL